MTCVHDSPRAKHPAAPPKPEIIATAVAVARWLGGNHRDESTGPTVKATGPPRPMAIWAALANLQKEARIYDV